MHTDKKPFRNLKNLVEQRNSGGLDRTIFIENFLSSALDKEMPADAKDQNGNTIWHFAVKNHIDTEIFPKLSGKFGHLINDANDKGKTPLFFALSCRNVKQSIAMILSGAQIGDTERHEVSETMKSTQISSYGKLVLLSLCKKRGHGEFINKDTLVTLSARAMSAAPQPLNEHDFAFIDFCLASGADKPTTHVSKTGNRKLHADWHKAVSLSEAGRLTQKNDLATERKPGTSL